MYAHCIAFWCFSFWSHLHTSTATLPLFWPIEAANRAPKTHCLVTKLRAVKYSPHFPGFPITWCVYTRSRMCSSNKWLGVLCLATPVCAGLANVSLAPRWSGHKLWIEWQLANPRGEWLDESTSMASGACGWADNCHSYHSVGVYEVIDFFALAVQ